MMNAVPKVKKGSIYFFGKVAEHLSGLMITWLLITKLSLEEFGIYNFFLGTSVYFAIFSSFGVVTTFHRYFPKFFHKNGNGSLYWIIKFGIALRIIILFAIIGLLYVFFEPVSRFFQIEGYWQHFLLFADGTLFTLQANFLQRIFETLMLQKYVAYANVIHTLIRFITVVVVFYLDYGFLYVLGSELFANLVLLGIYVICYKLNSNLAIERSKKTHYFSKVSIFKQFFSLSKLNFFNELGSVLIHLSTDFIIIAHFLGPKALGEYAFVAQISYLLSRFYPAKILRSIIIPVYLSRYMESMDRTELLKMFHLFTKISAFVFLPMLAAVAVLGKEFITHIFDSRYLDTYPVLIMMFIYYIILSLPVSVPLQIINKADALLIGKVALAHNFFLSIILVQIWGIGGVAFAAVSAVFLKKAFEYAAAKKYLNLTFPWMDILKILFNSAIVGAFALWVKPLLTNLGALAVFSFAAVIVYLAVSYLNMAFATEERRIIHQFIGKPYFRPLVEG